MESNVLKAVEEPTKDTVHRIVIEFLHFFYAITIDYHTTTAFFNVSMRYGEVSKRIQ